MTARTIRLVFVLGLLGLGHGGLAEATLSAPVSHLVGSTIYVSAGSMDGVVRGLRCFVSSGGKLLGGCHVRSVFATRSTIAFEDPQQVPSAGDQVHFWVEGDAQTPEVLQAWARERTIEDMARIGRAIVSYLADQARARPASAAGPVRVDSFPRIPPEELRGLLVPDYLDRLPEIDGWGNAYDFRFNRRDVFARAVTMVRSSGSDGAFDADSYLAGAVGPGRWSDDIVWADGVWIRWVEGSASGAKRPTPRRERPGLLVSLQHRITFGR